MANSPQFRPRVVQSRGLFGNISHAAGNAAQFVNHQSGLNADANLGCFRQGCQTVSLFHNDPAEGAETVGSYVLGGVLGKAATGLCRLACGPARRIAAQRWGQLIGDESGSIGGRAATKAGRRGLPPIRGGAHGSPDEVLRPGGGLIGEAGRSRVSESFGVALTRPRASSTGSDRAGRVSRAQLIPEHLCDSRQVEPLACGASRDPADPRSTSICRGIR